MPNKDRTPSKVLQVQFAENMGAEDIYRSPHTKLLYARMPMASREKVNWATIHNRLNSHEADWPLKEGTTIQVLDSTGRLLFEEVMGPELGDGALKTGPFSYEDEKRIAEAFAAQHCLYSYEQWKGYVLEDYIRFDYQGYADNWLFSETERLEISTIQKEQSLGRELEIRKDRYRHRFSKKTWDFYSLVDSHTLDILEICGYLW
ncbi:hypothetical protein [Merdimmobilis hominis]|uniref:hypothetical protein n=1 Tax=Merdimmobilis hominis TaxID=2897707 RepID=UPI0008F9347B|nr:hypothetical protein [Merdimmobilis hominis]